MGFHTAPVRCAEQRLAKKLIQIASPILFTLAFPVPNPCYRIQVTIMCTDTFPLSLTKPAIIVATAEPPQGSPTSSSTGAKLEKAWKTIDKEVSSVTFKNLIDHS